MSVRKPASCTSSANVTRTPTTVTHPLSSPLYARLVAPSPAAIAASSTTVPFSEMPLRTSRCDVWSWPPWWTGRPSTSRTAVTSAVSRIGTARTRSGRMRVATVVSATFHEVSSPREASVSPITWLPESPMNTAAGLRGRKLNGRKPATASASESDATSRRSSEWMVTGVDREERGGDDRERARQPVHVVEEVERVRHRHEPEDPEGRCGYAVGDDLDAEARRDDDDGRRDLRSQASRAAAASEGRRGARSRRRSTPRRGCPRSPTSDRRLRRRGTRRCPRRDRGRSRSRRRRGSPRRASGHPTASPRYDGRASCAGAPRS